MKELTRHIEALLLENDCVILPHFGGFVTNYAPARWVEEERLMLPPYRTIGFNPQLKINDGLLVQSYMQTHDATYPEATRLVESAIDTLSENLYKEGSVELNGIGILRRTIEGDYSFTPTEDGVITPSLYGFSSIEMKTLAQLATEAESQAETVVEEAATEQSAGSIIENSNHTLTIKIRHEWIANAVAVAAAVVLFFILSTPVGNTYIEEENYASLGTVNVFEQVKGESLITTLLETPKQTPAVAKATRPTQTKATTPKAEKPASVPTSTKAPEKPATTTTSAPKVTERPAEAPAQKVADKPTEATRPVTKAATAKPAEKPAPVAKPVEKKKTTITYNIIVASVGSENDANQAIKEFADKGQPGAFLIKGNGRFRIAIAAFENETDAYRKANELKQNPMFKDAWVLKDRRN